MATLGLCYVCSSPAARTCRLCGQAICARHAAPDAPHVCVQCAKGTVMRS